MTTSIVTRDRAALMISGCRAALLLFVVTIVAAWVPALRTSRLDPMTALRPE